MRRALLLAVIFVAVMFLASCSVALIRPFPTPTPTLEEFRAVVTEKNVPESEPLVVSWAEVKATKCEQHGLSRTMPAADSEYEVKVWLKNTSNISQVDISEVTGRFYGDANRWVSLRVPQDGLLTIMPEQTTILEFVTQEAKAITASREFTAEFIYFEMIIAHNGRKDVFNGFFLTGYGCVVPDELELRRELN